MAKKQREEVAETAIASPEVAKQEVAVRQEQSVVQSAPMDNAKAWGNGGMTSNDVVIPRLLLMQPMSNKVTDGAAKFGEFIDSLTDEALGNFDKPLDVIPFDCKKVWIEYNAEVNPKEFLRVVPITPQNENLPYNDEEYNEDAKKKIKISRDRVMNFYVLLPEHIKQGAAIPYILCFRRTSLQAGKKLMTQMYMKNTSAGMTPASMVVTVSCKKLTNEDKQTYAVMDVRPLKKSTADEVQEAFKWYSLVSSGKTRDHEESYNEDSSGSSSEGSSDIPSSGESASAGPAQF